MENMMDDIPFNKPFMTGRELERIQQAHANSQLAGDGAFTRGCQAWLEEETGCAKAFLTHSCTAALEMAGLLAGLQPGDEVIMPSYTFVSTANAVVLRGAVPVFVDIHPTTLNLNEHLVKEAITPNTSAIIAVHYAGVGCEMDALVALADEHNLVLIEDAAQGLMASYKGKPLGTMGQLGCISFHETKNVISGEGGALLVNNPDLVERAEVLWEKGTNRKAFFEGRVDKYSWVDVGSSFLPGEITAAFLSAQLEEAEAITRRRMDAWQGYFDGLAELAQARKIRLPFIPEHCVHNAHTFYLLANSAGERRGLIEHLAEKGIHAIFHYVPLHGSPAGRKYGRVHGLLGVTEEAASTLVRLPMFPELERGQVDRVVAAVRAFFGYR